MKNEGLGLDSDGTYVGERMPQFSFATTNGDGASGSDALCDLQDYGSAIKRARKALATMALDGLPDEARPFSVRVYDGSGEILAELSLEFRAEFFSSRYPDPLQ
ncbi:DUF6894 family protein [Mycoplana rhizolycopersici]|uniref:DUF6894 domain-containing protein n=1 Tax=Mycoplana rhizolycopersici TaxID=2746702 RepID=A0ABX2QBT3_9HYPH|nr:hypothetical protein [Rhizobium rhizolycopersici]NVP54643.1 hypothetical protein [Rhizobium rhizolycopersici]